jgi:putative hydrolase of the HAD superfamily
MVHVGDHYEFDYLVPRALGIRAFYLDRSARSSEDSVIRDLADFEKRLALDESEPNGRSDGKGTQSGREV